MNEAQKKHIKDSIQEELTHLSKKLHTLQQEIKPLKKSCAYDDAEYAFLCDDMAMKERELTQLQKRYEELQRALSRMDRSDYGVCEMCDEEIEEERLRLSPDARLCVECLKESRSL